MKIILAVDQNWGIGKDNEMLFHLKKDLQHFKDLTIGNIVIMGRSTYESIGKALANRDNLVLTRNKDYKLDDALIFNNIDDLLAYLNGKSKEVFVIGGSEIVEIFLSYVDEAIITKIKAKKDADTYLHNFDQDPYFEIISESKEYEENEINFSYVTYRRKNEQNRNFCKWQMPTLPKSI